MRRAASPLTCLLLLGLAAPAAAQTQPGETPPAPPAPTDEPDDAADADDAQAAALARGEALLAGFTGLHEPLLGSSWYGMYVRGQSVGRVEIVTARAPDGAPAGAVYEVTTRAEMRFGPNVMRTEETSLLDAGLAVLAAEEVSTELVEGKVTERRTTLRREGDAWVRARTQGDEAARWTLPAGPPNHADVTSYLLLARRLDLSAPGPYALHAIDWPKAEGKEPRWRTPRVIVTPPAPLSHRGEQVQAHLVQVAPLSGGATTFAVHATRGVLAFWSDQVPIRFVAAADEAGARADLPPEEAPSKNGGPAAAAADPKAAVMTYFAVIARTRPVSALDAVMDWEALHAEMAAENPRVASIPPSLFAELLKDQFAAREAPIGEPELRLLADMLKARVDEQQPDRAQVVVPGKEQDPFRLRKAEDGWRITHFPH